MKIFISYSHENEDTVLKITNGLQSLCGDLDIWLDAIKIAPGDSIIQFMEEGIKVSDYFIVVLSKASVASRWVQEEISAALIKQVERKGTFIIPILIESCSIPLLLASKKYIDFVYSFEKGMDALAKFLKYEDAISASAERRIIGAVAELRQLPVNTSDLRLTPVSEEERVVVDPEEVEEALDELKSKTLVSTPDRTRDYYYLRESVIRVQGDKTIYLLIKRNDGSLQKVLINRSGPFSLLIADLAKEIGVEASKVLLIDKERGQTLDPNSSPLTARLQDGNSLIVVYYDEQFHTYSATAQIGKPVELPNKLNTGFFHDHDDMPPVMRGLMYGIEKNLLFRKDPANFRNADLSGGSLKGKNLPFANFSGASLTGTDFSKCNLAYADFSSTNLRGADFRGANLSNACFLRSNLILIRFDENTNWDHADLSNIMGLPPGEFNHLISRGARQQAIGMQASIKDLRSFVVGCLFVILPFLLGNLFSMGLGLQLAIVVSHAIIPTAQHVMYTIARYIIGTPIFLLVWMGIAVFWWDLFFNMDIIWFTVRRWITRILYKLGFKLHGLDQLAP